MTVAFRALLYVFAILLLSFSWLSTEVSAPNERSRIYLTVALVDHGTVSIDEPVERFGRVSDRAQRDGKLYSDKAPGSSLLAAPLYWLATSISSGKDWSIEALLLLMRFGLMLPITAMGFLLIYKLLRRLQIEQRHADFAVLAWAVATPVLHYGQAFYGHQIVALSLVASVFLLLDDKSNPWKMFLAGAFAGIAGFTEYQAAIPCLILAIWVLTEIPRRPPLQIFAFFVGTIPFITILLAYHHAAFGGPLELSYHHLEDPTLYDRHTFGIGGVFLPTWDAFSGAIFSLSRGLLATAPILIVTGWGWTGLREAIGYRRTILIGGCLLYFILFVSSSNTWFGGWSYGPRLLVPIFGLAALPLAFGLRKIQKSWWLHTGALSIFSIGVFSNLAMKVSFFEAPPKSSNPLFDIAWQSLISGMSAPSLLTQLGASPRLSHIFIFTIAAALVSLTVFTQTDRRPVVTLICVFAALVAYAVMVASLGPGWNEVEAQRFMNLLTRVSVTSS